MRSRDLIKLLSAETGIPDRSDPRITIWCNAQGKLHRNFGPAIETVEGTQYWYQNGLVHREDGPALVRADGTQVWYRNGRRHREDGPAVVWPEGTKEWWVNGKRKPAPAREPLPPDETS